MEKEIIKSCGNMLTCYNYRNALQISPNHDKLRENVR